MVSVQREATIACSVDEWLEFVMDPKRYAEVDDKLGTILWARRIGDVTEFTFRPKLPGLRLPEPRTVSQMRLTPGERVDARLAPLPRNVLGHGMSRFRGSFAGVAVDGGTRVTRTISFAFNPLVRPLFEPVLRRTLPESVERELRLSKQILEGASR